MSDNEHKEIKEQNIPLQQRTIMLLIFEEKSYEHHKKLNEGQNSKKSETTNFRLKKVRAHYWNKG